MRAAWNLSAVAVTGLALAASLAPAQAASSPGWRITKLIGPVNGVGRLYAVAAPSSGDAWSVGNENPSILIERWGNGRWISIPPKGFAQDGLLNGVAQMQPSFGATSAKNAWIFVGASSGPQAWHWNGTAWARIAMPSWVAPVDRTGSRGVTPVVDAHGGTWVFSTGAMGYAARYSGGKWSKVPLPGYPESIAPLSASDIWAAGPSNKTHGTVLMHWNGSVWHTIAFPKIALTSGETLTASNVVSVSDHSIWVRAAIYKTTSTVSFLLHWNGSGWTKASVPPLGYVSQAGMAQDGHGGLWLAAYGPAPSYQPYFYHYGSGHWTRQVVPGDNGTPNNKVELLGMTWIPGTRSLWAVGQSIASASGVQAVILKYGP